MVLPDNMLSPKEPAATSDGQRLTMVLPDNRLSPREPAATVAVAVNALGGVALRAALHRVAGVFGAHAEPAAV